MSKIQISKFNLVLFKPNVDTLSDAIQVPGWNSELLQHNWKSSFKIETSYSTTISTARKTQTEERKALLGRPHRVVQVRWDSIPLEYLERLLHLMRYMNEEKFLVPIYMDQSELAADYDKDGTDKTKVKLNTSFRRYFKNGYAAFWKGGDWAFRQVQKVRPDQIEIPSALPWSATVGEMLIYPCLTCSQLLSTQTHLVSDEIASLQVDLHEDIGSYGLPPSWTGFPPGWSKYDGLPIVDPMYLHNWTSRLVISDARAGINTAQGRGRYTEIWGDAPRRTTSLGLMQGREEAFRLLQLFDTCRGRLNPLWVIDASGGWKVVAKGSATLDVQKRGSVSYLGEVAYLGLTDKSGKSEIKKVLNVTEVGDVWRFSLESSFSMAVEDVVHCARARKSRFGKDALVQEAITDEVILTQVLFTEVFGG